ncbi:MAG: hypothetical protein IT562_19625 [Alphaproteobacteria bacterium]|nr:hypothetical protein [Alphaproteobacteria bacterium]
MANPPASTTHFQATDVAVKNLSRAMEGPIEVDQVQIGDQGQLWPRTGTEPIRFTFLDCGRPFLARLVRVGERARLHIAGAIAQLPYTVESPALRTALLAAIRGAPRPSLGRLVVGPGQTICVEAELAFEAPVTPNRLIAAAAMFVAATRPAAECIDAAGSGTAPPPAATPRRRR